MGKNYSTRVIRTTKSNKEREEQKKREKGQKRKREELAFRSPRAFLYMPTSIVVAASPFSSLFSSPYFFFFFFTLLAGLMGRFPHPLYDQLFQEPRVGVPDEAVALVLCLPPAHALATSMDADYLASHVFPLMPAHVAWPRPKASLSASSVLARITSPRNDPHHQQQQQQALNPRPPSQQKPLPSTPVPLEAAFAASLPALPTLPPSSPSNATSRRASSIGSPHTSPSRRVYQQATSNSSHHSRRPCVTLNDKTLYASNQCLYTGHGFQHRTRAAIRYTRLTQCQWINKRSFPLLLLYLDAPLVKNELPSVPRVAPSTHPRSQLLPTALDDTTWDAVNAMLQTAADRVVLCEDMDQLHITVADLIDRAIQMVDHALELHDISKMHHALESHIMEQMYDVVFFKITQLELVRDQHLGHVMERIKGIDLSQLGLPEGVHVKNNEPRRRVKRAVDVLQHIGAYRTPAEKLDCLLSVIRLLSSSKTSHPPPSPSPLSTACTANLPSSSRPSLESRRSFSSSSMSSSTDTLVPLLLFTLIQSRIPHLTAHWTYMKEFAFHHDVTHGAAGFALSTLEAVLAYVDQSAEAALADLAQRNQQMGDTDPWLRDRDGNTILMRACLCRPSSFSKTAKTSTTRRPRARSRADSASNPDHEENKEDKEEDDAPLRLVQALWPLYEHDAVASMVNDVGDTVLMLAIRGGSDGLVAWLLERVSTPLYLAMRNDRGQTAAHLAATQKTDKMLKLLARVGAPLDRIDVQGNSPLHVACLARAHAATRFLLETLPSDALLRPNTHKQTFFHVCQDDTLLIAHADHLPRSPTLGRHASPMALAATAPDAFGRTPWLAWAHNGQFQAMAALLDHPTTDTYQLRLADVPLVSLDDNASPGSSPSLDEACFGVSTALHDLARHWPLLVDKEHHEKWIDALVYRLGDVVDVPDPNGQRPLHLAVMAASTLVLSNASKPLDAHLRTYEHFVWALLHAGADPLAVNRMGQQPIDLLASASSRVDLAIGNTDGGLDAWRRVFAVWHLMAEERKRKERHKRRHHRRHLLSSSTSGTPSPLSSPASSSTSSTPSSMGIHWALTHTLLDKRQHSVAFVITSAHMAKGQGSNGTTNGHVGQAHLQMETVHRAWHDFFALRDYLLHEHPEYCLPRLKDTAIDPLIFDLHPPPPEQINQCFRALHRFLLYLKRHPVLRHHDQVLRFVQASTFDKAVLEDHSYSKRNLMLETLGRVTPPPSSEEFDEGSFLSYTQDLLTPLVDALTTWLARATVYLDCHGGVADAWNQVAHDAGPLTLLTGKHRCIVKVCASLSCDTMGVSPLTTLIESVAMINDMTQGVLSALQYPWTLLDEKAKLLGQLEKQREAVQKGQHPPWNGFFAGHEHTRQLDRDKQLVTKTLQDLQRVTNQIHQSHQLVSDELALHQRRHADDMVASLQGYARKQLKMEKLKLRWLIQMAQE
ncbi:hypothetical protein BC940DRAFT_35000 [Gongronella butleri]|nr:hypothetical protein BC940DRAFT_35000 [Gongronella butleri]